MSEQSPWGTPPPSHQWGPPPTAPPPPPAPPGGYYGGPAGPTGPRGPGGHAGPPRRNTGLIVALVALVVVLVVGAVVTVVLVAGGDGDGQAGPTSEPTSKTTSETETSTEPTSPTGTGAAGDPVTGDGYRYALPTGEWRDRSDQAATLGATIDTVIVLGPSVELSQSAVFVEVLPNPGVDDVTDIRDAWARNVKANDGATTEPIDPITVDGEPAVGVDVANRKNNAGVKIKQRAYLTLHDDLQVGIYLTYPASGDAVSVDDFQKVLDSWRWES